MADNPDKPYGDVKYADPGYQSDDKKRYPLDSEEHCRAAWSYINQASNAAKYTPDQLRLIKGRIRAALKKYGVEVAEDDVGRAAWLEERLVGRAWTENLHPRAPKGQDTGGEFTSQSSGGGPKAAPAKKAVAAKKTTAKKAVSKAGGGGGHQSGPNDTISFDGKSGTGYGMPGGDKRVHTLQEALNRLGLTDANGKKLVLDGKLGPKTTAAIKAAQKRLGLKVDGVVSPALFKQLTAARTLPVAKKATPKMRSEFGVDVSDDDMRSLAPQLFLRSYPLEDIRILSRAQGAEYADGRTVEAYAAVFDREAEIYDDQGHYMEVIDRSAFNRAIDHSRPQGSRTAWRTGVFYNHGMTLHGTPSDKFSVPIGTPVDIKVTDHGLLTVTRYNSTSLADEILELIRSGDITGHSFTGAILRSDPRLSSRRGYQRNRDGTLQRVRRMELGLREYGPTPFPAYADAGVVGVRSMFAGFPWSALLSATRDAAMRELVESGIEPDEAARSVADDPLDSGTPSDEGPAPDDSPDEGHSSRESLLRRIAAAKTTRPGLARPEERSQ